MKNIFLNQSQSAIFDMIKILNKQPTHSCTIKKLAEELDKSPATINGYIHELLQYNKSCDKEYFKLEDNVLSETPKSEFHIADFFDYTVKKSVEFKLLEGLLHGDFVNFDIFADKLAISRSKFQKHIKPLREFIEENFDITINFKKTTQLQGTELQIRFFYYTVYWQLNNIIAIGNNAKMMEISALFLEIIPAADIFSILKTSVYCGVIAKRISNGFYIQDSESLYINDHPAISYDAFKEKVLATTFFDRCSNEHLESECRHLYLVFSLINLIPLNLIEKHNITTDNFFDETTENIITTIEEMLPFTMTPTERAYLFINMYYVHKGTELFKGSIRIYGIYDITKDLQKSRPRDMAMVEEILKKLKEKHEILNTWFDDFPNIEYMYKLMFSEILIKHKKTLNVFVNTKVSSLQYEMLCNFIKDISLIPIRFMSTSEVFEKDPDCIISDWISLRKTQDIPYFNVSSQYRDWDLSAIELFLLDLVDGDFE